LTEAIVTEDFHDFNSVTSENAGIKNAPDGLIPYLSQFIIQNHPTI